MVMNDDDEDVNNDKAYDDDTCDVHIDEARFNIIEVGGYACKASVDYENGNDVQLLIFLFMTTMMMMTLTTT
jgi:hypothetical protein